MSAVGEFPGSGKCRNRRSGATWDYAKDGPGHVRVFNGPPGSTFADRIYAIADFTSRFTPIGPCIVEAGVYKAWVKALPDVFPSAEDAEKAVEQAINDDATGVWELRMWRLSFV